MRAASSFRRQSRRYSTMTDDSDEVFHLIKAFARSEVDDVTLSTKLRGFQIDDVCEGVSTFCEVWGPSAASAAIEAADLPLKMEPVSAFFVFEVLDHDERLAEFSPS